MKEVAEALLSLPAPAQDAPASFDVAHAETLIREIPKSFTQPNFPSALPISAKESGESSPLQSISADRPPHESSAGSPEPPPFAPPSTPSRRLWRNISGLFFLAFSASVGFFLWQQMSPPSHQHIPPQNRLASSTNRRPVVSPSSSATPTPPHPTSAQASTPKIPPFRLLRLSPPNQNQSPIKRIDKLPLCLLPITNRRKYLTKVPQKYLFPSYNPPPRNLLRPFLRTNGTGSRSLLSFLLNIAFVSSRETLMCAFKKKPFSYAKDIL